MIDLRATSRRWQLPRAQDGDALGLDLGLRLVVWGPERFAIYGNDARLVRDVGREVRGTKLEFNSHHGSTISFPENRLGQVLHIIDGMTRS